MSDEQMQHHDLEDAIRRAESQLEEQIERLRTSALTDVVAQHAPAAEVRVDDDVAVMRPTGVVQSAAADDGWDIDSSAVWGEPAAAADVIEWDDAPVSGESDAGGVVFDEPVSVPDDEWNVTAGPVDATETWGAPVPTTGGFVFEEAPTRPSRRESWEQVTSGPSDEQLQFWAQTRTALRLLQQTTDDIAPSISSSVSDRVEQLVRDEMSAPNATLRQLQQQLPVQADRIEQMVRDEMEAPLAALRQIHEELPLQLDRLERGVTTFVDRGMTQVADDVRTELDRVGERLETSSTEVERKVHEDITHVEQTVATNVTRMTQGLATQVGRVERSMTESFERIEQQLDHELKRVEAGLRQDAEAPYEVVRQLGDELPSRLTRLERSIQEHSSTELVERVGSDVSQLAAQQRELGSFVREELAPTRRDVQQLVELDIDRALSGLAKSQDTTLDRIGGVTGAIERERVQRAEDLELVVDAMSSGWKAVFGAVEQMLERVDTVDQRMASLETRISEIGRLEVTVEEALSTMKTRLDHSMESMELHLRELQPAPVIVTVNHPNAEVAQQTRGGHISIEKDSEGATS